MKHDTHSMHENSLAAYYAEEPKLSTRAQAILSWIELHGPHTDREIAHRMGFAESGAVRPRITELIQAGKLLEVCSRRCEVTGKRVRVVDLRRARIYRHQEALL
jgi:predicted HTH transcriptional regulator